MVDTSSPKVQVSIKPGQLQSSDRENARIEHDKALLRVMTSMMKDDNQLFKQFMDNAGFKRWMTDTVFALTSEQMNVVRVHEYPFPGSRFGVRFQYCPALPRPSTFTRLFLVYGSGSMTLMTT